MSSLPRHPQTRPGGRSQRVRRAVLEAASRLAEQGAADVSVASLAKLSGVSEVTIYRRWGSAENVLLEAAVDDINRRLPLKPTGDLRRDLIAWAEGLEHSLATARDLRLLSAVISATTRDGHPAVQDYLGQRRSALQALIDAASPQSAITVEDALDRVAAPLYLRRLLQYESERGAAELVDDLLRAAPSSGPR